MRELFDKCQKLVLDNFNGTFDKVVLEAMTIAVMALCLRNEKRTLERLPGLLQNLVIYVENDSVLNIARKNINNFNDSVVDENIEACVIRGFGRDDATGEYYEDKCLVVSTVNLFDNPSDIIMKITHEFTHLLRDGKFSVDGNAFKMKNGISVVRVTDFESGIKKTKHFYFEEGIVQRYTNQALDILHEFIKGEDLPDDSLLTVFRQDYPSRVKSAYELQVKIIDTLCKDGNFDALVDESFEETDTPSQLAIYYNNKMSNSSAFTNLSKDVDCCFESLIAGDAKKTETYYRSALTQVAAFLKHQPIKKYY